MRNSLPACLQFRPNYLSHNLREQRPHTTCGAQGTQTPAQSRCRGGGEPAQVTRALCPWRWVRRQMCAVPAVHACCRLGRTASSAATPMRSRCGSAAASTITCMGPRCPAAASCATATLAVPRPQLCPSCAPPAPLAPLLCAIAPPPAVPHPPAVPAPEALPAVPSCAPLPSSCAPLPSSCAQLRPARRGPAAPPGGPAASLFCSGPLFIPSRTKTPPTFIKELGFPSSPPTEIGPKGTSGFTGALGHTSLSQTLRFADTAGEKVLPGWCSHSKSSCPLSPKENRAFHGCQRQIPYFT